MPDLPTVEEFFESVHHKKPSGFLYEVSPRDPVTFAAVGLVVAVVTMAAAWVPARRATRIDPAMTIRDA